MNPSRVDGQVLRHRAAMLSRASRSYSLASIALLATLVLLTIPSRAAVGDTVLPIQCPQNHATTVYAEGLSSPDGLAFSPDGVLFVAEEAAGRVSRLDVYGRVAPVIEGLDHPEGIAFDDAGHLYVVEDVKDGRVVKATTDGVTTTLAANRDGPEGVVWAPDGTVYFTESNVEFAQTLPWGIQTRVTAISPGGGVATVRSDDVLYGYGGISIGPDGLLYVSNEASGAGLDESIFAVHPVTGLRTLFASDLMAPEGLAFSSDGGFPLYVAEEDIGSGNGRVSLVDADGSHAPFCIGFSSVKDVVLDGSGRVYVSEDGQGLVVRVEPSSPNRTSPRAIILFIGDGMGEVQRVAARWSEMGQIGALAMDVMRYGGWTRTASANGSVTDSAAAATAIATGVKTDNGVVGQDPYGNRLTTILERAKAQGMAVGLVTNTQLAHATPAAFAAHVAERSSMTEIARQLLEAGVDVLLGGGEDEFLPQTAVGCFSEPGERTDGRDLIYEAMTAGYTYVCDAATLDSVAPAPGVRLLGLFADEGMLRPFSPSLVEMTQKAIDVLAQDPDGFFLMVEGGQIDWVSHLNHAGSTISDTTGLDEAVAVAQSFATDAGDTLIIVTGDHETGGMSVDLDTTGAAGEDGPFYMPGGTPFYVNWTTTGHTGADVPTVALGPWSDLLVGTYENTHIHDVMRLALESRQIFLPALFKGWTETVLVPDRR